MCTQSRLLKKSHTATMHASLVYFSAILLLNHFNNFRHTIFQDFFNVEVNQLALAGKTNISIWYLVPSTRNPVSIFLQSSAATSRTRRAGKVSIPQFVSPYREAPSTSYIIRLSDWGPPDHGVDI